MLFQEIAARQDRRPRHAAVLIDVLNFTDKANLSIS